MKIENKSKDDRFDSVMQYIDCNSRQKTCGNVKFLVNGLKQINDHTFLDMGSCEISIDTSCGGSYKHLNPTCLSLGEIFDGERLKSLLNEILDSPLIEVSIAFQWKCFCCMCGAFDYYDYEDEDERISS